ncbi:MAG: hypothetical protein JWO98_5383, partial [Frankiales bacterium]|nr:hypothetical protein [Frankiales bacterium]
MYEDEPELEWLRDKGRRLLRKHNLPTEVARLPLPDEAGRIASNNKQTRDIEVWSLGQHWWVEKNLGKAWWNRAPLSRNNQLAFIPVNADDVPEPYGTTLLKGARSKFRETVAAYNVGLGLESGVARLVKHVKALTGEGRLSGICERTD